MTDKLQVSPAPDFTAVDSEGRTFRLSDYRGRKNIVLVFNRGFFWPYCRKHMAQLRQDYRKFTERDTEVVAIGPEDAPQFTEWWHANHMPFIGIPDPEHNIARLYGQKSRLLKGGRMPALAVIDKDQQIRFMHFGDSMSDIPSDERLLTLLDELNNQVASS